MTVLFFIAQCPNFFDFNLANSNRDFSNFMLQFHVSFFFFSTGDRKIYGKYSKFKICRRFYKFLEVLGKDGKDRHPCTLKQSCKVRFE